MTIRHMKIFIEVYQAQSITQAAHRLNMTQPAVTRTIQEIESYYGVCLFDRMNRRLYTTETGQQLYVQALHIVDAFDTMEKGLRNWDTLGLIRVGASVTLGNFILPELVSLFQKEYPNMKIRAFISNGGNLEKCLLDNELDLALIEGGVEDVKLHTEPIGEDRLVLVVSQGHPLLARDKVALQEVLEYPVLLRERGSTARAFLDNCFAVRGLMLAPMWESISTQAIVKAVSCGIGISFLPEQLVQKNIASGDICTRDIVDANFTRQHYLVWHKNKFLTETMKNFIRLCVERGSSVL